MTTLDDVRLAIVVVAAGSGSRLGRDAPKAFVDVAGMTILEHALRGVFRASRPAQVIVVAPAALQDDARAIAERAAGAASGHVVVVAGGPSRQTSVAAGLAALAPGVEAVLVHDAARALTPSALIDRVAETVLADGRGVIPALPVVDTVKRVDGSRVVEAVDRSELVAVQTPQGFPRDVLVAAYADAPREHTDDAALVAAAGHPIMTIEGDPRAFKITTPWDLNRAEHLLAGDRPAHRTGIGVDAHRFDPASPLWLGGVLFPDEPGLAGHSDGDAVIHAMCDALLSAAGLGDIGSRFGSAAPEYAGAASEVFLRETLALVAAGGFRVGNVAVQVIANQPRLAPRRAELEARLSTLVGAPVSVAATTSDGLGFSGRGEGLVAIATALLH